MKKIKIFLSSLLMIILMLNFVGCSNIETDNDKLNIVSTIFPGYDFARAVVKDDANLTMLLKAGSESHAYDPTPKDIIKIQNADIFIYVGGESDEWVNSILTSIDTSNMIIIKMMDYITPIEEVTVEGMTAEEEESNEIEYDEHIWTSPINAKILVETIKDKIIKKDKTNEQKYIENTNEYIKELSSIDSQIRAIISNSKRTELVFGDRFPFAYFAKEYGLTYSAAFPGCASETEPSAKTVAYLINKVNNKHIPVIFYLELSNKKVAQSIKESTEAKLLMLHSCHNVTADDFNSGITYVDLWKENIKNLREALN